MAESAATSPAAAKPKPASARHHLTIAEKNQLRACHRSHPDMTQELLRDWAHSKFGKWVGRSTIGKITSSPDEVCVNQDAKRNQSGRFPDMERALFEFVLATAGAGQSAAAGPLGDAEAAAARGHTVGEHHPSPPALNDAVLWAKANEILKRTLGEQHAVSVGWVQRFKKRHGLHKGQKRTLQHFPGVSPSLATTSVDDPVAAVEMPFAGVTETVSAAIGAGNLMVVDREAVALPVDGPKQRGESSSSRRRTPSEARRTKGPARKQFLAVDDILLLTQALLVKPWTFSEPMNGWQEVADELRRLESFGLDKSAGACQARANLLVEHARSGNEAALRKSGSAEEFQQKKELLAEIVTELDRASDAANDTNSRKRPASDLSVSTAAPDSSRRRTTLEASSQGDSTAVNSGVASASHGDRDDVTRRLALLETKLELELAVQRRNSEQQVRELGKQYQQQLERHQRQFDQQLASIQQQQVTIIELLKVVVERSSTQAQRRP